MCSYLCIFVYTLYKQYILHVICIYIYIYFVFVVGLWVKWCIEFQFWCVYSALLCRMCVCVCGGSGVQFGPSLFVCLFMFRRTYSYLLLNLIFCSNFLFFLVWASKYCINMWGVCVEVLYDVVRLGCRKRREINKNRHLVVIKETPHTVQ